MSSSLDVLARLTLQLGRILLLNGTDTEQVQLSLSRFAAAFGADESLLTTYEAVLVSVAADGEIRTKISCRVPGMGVGMTAIEAPNRLVDDVCAGRLRLEEVQAELDAIEHRSSAHAEWFVAAALGMTAASLSRLFGGDLLACLATGLADAAGAWARLKLAHRRVNPVLTAFAVAPAMILIPGVPLISGILDMIRNHVTIGMCRLGFAALVVLAIALGLFGAAQLARVAMPVNSSTLTIGVAQDALFSALAAGGLAMLFNAPLRMAWACGGCGVVSHTLRAALFHGAWTSSRAR
jgi:uncharacterized membrane protein YjjP (DUF1212 family)